MNVFIKFPLENNSFDYSSFLFFYLLAKLKTREGGWDTEEGFARINLASTVLNYTMAHALEISIEICVHQNP